MFFFELLFSFSQDKNYLISPYSILLSFTMFSAGAKKNTESEFRRLVNCNNLLTNDMHREASLLIDYIERITTSIDISSKTLNRIFIKNGIKLKSEYRDLVRNLYKSDVCQIDFSNRKHAVSDINEWLDTQFAVKFNRKIADYALNEDMKILLLNASHFRGNWLKKFDKRLTMKAKFFLHNGSVLPVDMMTLYNRKFRYQSNAAELNAAICELPYVDNKLSMTIVLPHKHTDLVTIESQLTPEVLKDILESYSFLTKVNVHIPKFRMENNLEV
jgi:serine protease inhibitor